MKPSQITPKSLPACNFTHTFPTLKSDWKEILISLVNKPNTTKLVFFSQNNATELKDTLIFVLSVLADDMNSGLAGGKLQYLKKLKDTSCLQSTKQELQALDTILDKPNTKNKIGAWHEHLKNMTNFAIKSIDDDKFLNDYSMESFNRNFLPATI